MFAIIESMKKVIKTKKVTTDDLAIMVAKGFDSLGKDIKGLKKDVGELKKDMGEVKEEVKGIKNQLEGTNRRIDDFVITRVKYEDHNKLKVRVDFIEKKFEICPVK